MNISLRKVSNSLNERQLLDKVVAAKELRSGQQDGGSVSKSELLQAGSISSPKRSSQPTFDGEASDSKMRVGLRQTIRAVLWKLRIPVLLSCLSLRELLAAFERIAYFS